MNIFAYPYRFLRRRLSGRRLSRFRVLRWINEYVLLPLVKVDAEGCETEGLSGMARILKSRQSRLICEVTVGDVVRTPKKIRRMLVWLDRLRYKIYRIHEFKRALLPVTVDEIMLSPKTIGGYVANPYFSPPSSS